jgi:hypothetical protein
MSSSTITQRSSTSPRPTTTSQRSGYIAFLKLIAFLGVVLDIVFHWLESGTWVGLLAFLIDGFEVANQNLHGGASFVAMQGVSVLAHAGFLAGLLALLFTPMSRAPGHSLSGIKQVFDLPSDGRGRWLTYGSVAAVVFLGVVLVGLSLKGTGVI